MAKLPEYFYFRCKSNGKEIVLEDASDTEVEEVKHGWWDITDAYPHNVYCSVCFKRFAQTHWAVWEDGSLPRNYCPNCGAKMDGAKETENEE